MCTGCSPLSRIIKLIRISVLLHLSIGPQPHSGGSHAVAEVESIPTTVKADEVETIGTLIKLFSRVKGGLAGCEESRQMDEQGNIYIISPTSSGRCPSQGGTCGN